MPNLFPINSIESITPKENKTFELKGSYAIDFETMKFKKNLDGTVKKLNGYEAYMQWCQLAMMTIRNEYKAYSSLFGRDKVDTSLSKQAIELEVKRITVEALMVHPNTKTVDSFVFAWKNNYSELYYDFNVTPIQGPTKILSNTIQIK